MFLEHLQVAALSVGDYYNEHFVKLYTIFMAQLQGILPPGTDIPAAYAGGTDDEQVNLVFCDRVLLSRPLALIS
jgi:hypothetical protein